MEKIKSVLMLSDVIATGASGKFPNGNKNGKSSFQAYGATSAGSGAATIKIQVSNVPDPGTNDWMDLGTITLTLGTTRVNDGFANDAVWRHYRANVTVISGTDAAVSVYMGG